MDAWLKAAVDKAATVADAAGKLGEEAQKRAADLGLEVPGLLLSEGERELTFERGRLGFDLDGVHVGSVEPGSQADLLGVKVGDRLRAIAGYKVPGPKSEEAEEVARARAVAKKWLKEMPRPSPLLFCTPASAAAQLVPPPAAPATPLEGARAEFQVAGVQSPEAMRIMLDYVYLVGTGAPWEYKPSSAEVNKDILRLARSFGLDHLHEYAARWLARGLTTTNVVERLVTCEEFGLGLLREKIIEQLGANPAELMIVSSSPAIMKHPHILQDLLVKVASCNAAATAAKKAAAEPVAEVVPMAVEKPEAKAEEAADKPADSKSQQKASTRAETKAEKAAAAERAAADKPTAKRAKRGAAGA